MDNEIVKNTKLTTLKTKVNKLDEKISNAFTLTHIIQYNTDNQNLKENIGDVDKKIPHVIGLVITNFPKTKIKEDDNKILDLKGLFNKRDYDAKISEIEWKCFTASHYHKFTSEKHDTKMKQK